MKKLINLILKRTPNNNIMHPTASGEIHLEIGHKAYAKRYKFKKWMMSIGNQFVNDHPEMLKGYKRLEDYG